jgi:hypothetical protein
VTSEEDPDETLGKGGGHLSSFGVESASGSCIANMPGI